MNTTTATERPIPFSAAMVRAISAGTKTQTRRALKKQPPNGFKASNCGRPSTMCFHPDYFPYREGFGFDLGRSDRTQEFWPKVHERSLYCPYGQPGDRLWVREGWKAHSTFDHLPPRDIPQSHVWYLADDGYMAESRTRASMHMPRWASRFSLEITGVRVERLQDISIEDAKAEGAWGPDESIVGKVADYFGIDVLGVNPRLAYRMLWEQINGTDSWEANPWVWAVEFKRI